MNSKNQNIRNTVLGIFAVIIIAGLAFGAYYLGNKKQEPPKEEVAIISPTNTEISPTVSPVASETPPTVSPSPTIKVENDSQLIKAALFKKNNWPADDPINVTVSTNDGTYASGSADGEGGGGYFYAEKVNGIWEIVADGNGTISCSIFNKYPNFPKTLIPECYDEATQNSVKR